METLNLQQLIIRRCLLMKKTIIKLITASLVISATLFALPTDEVYIERVLTGLRFHRDLNRMPGFSDLVRFPELHWHIKEMGGEHLTEEKLTQMTPLFKELIQKERELSGTHYQVITAQDAHFLAYQIILKELYRALYKEDFQAFEFIRPYRDPELASHLEQFLSDHSDLVEIGKIYSTEEELDEEVYEEYKATKESDSLPTIRRQLISASLTLETWSPFDSALHVLAHGAGMCQKAENEILKELLTHAFALEGLEGESIEACLETLIDRAPRSREGVVLQIFIPKKEVSRLTFVAHPGGFVKENETEAIHTYFGEHEKERDSEVFDSMQNDQVRLLAGLLKPENVQIFRYTTVEQEVIQDYTDLVRSAIRAEI